MAERLVEWLQKGNSKFQEQVQYDKERYEELAQGQSPPAIVLACADSRVGPEIVFGKALGEVFVVRVAGNVATTESIASIEYAVAHLGSRLVVVLAHQSCGAVAAALQGADAGKNLNQLIGQILPALDATESRDVNVVAQVNARLNAERLTAESDILREAVDGGNLEIVPAFLHFGTGEVEFDPAP